MRLLDLPQAAIRFANDNLGKLLSGKSRVYSIFSKIVIQGLNFVTGGRVLSQINAKKLEGKGRRERSNHDLKLGDLSLECGDTTKIGFEIGGETDDETDPSSPASSTKEDSLRSATTSEKLTGRTRKKITNYLKPPNTTKPVHLGTKKVLEDFSLFSKAIEGIAPLIKQREESLSKTAKILLDQSSALGFKDLTSDQETVEDLKNTLGLQGDNYYTKLPQELIDFLLCSPQEAKTLCNDPQNNRVNLSKQAHNVEAILRLGQEIVQAHMAQHHMYLNEPNERTQEEHKCSPFIGDKRAELFRIASETGLTKDHQEIRDYVLTIMMLR